jgi:NAD+ synthase
MSTMTGLTAEQVERVYRLIDSKRKATRYLHMQPLLIDNEGGMLSPCSI